MSDQDTLRRLRNLERSVAAMGPGVTDSKQYLALLLEQLRRQMESEAAARSRLVGWLPRGYKPPSFVIPPMY